MISSDQNIACVRCCEFLYQSDYIVQGALRGFEGLSFRVHLVTGMIDAIMVDIDNIVAFQQVATPVAIKLHEGFRGNCCPPSLKCGLQDLRTVRGTLGALPIYQHSAGFIVSNH